MNDSAGRNTPPPRCNAVEVRHIQEGADHIQRRIPAEGGHIRGHSQAADNLGPVRCGSPAAVVRRDLHIAAVATLHIAAVAPVVVTAIPSLTFRGDNCSRRATNNRAKRRAPSAACGATNNCTSCATEETADQRILRRCLLGRYDEGKREGGGEAQ